MTPPPRVPAGFGDALYELRKARGWSMLRAAGAAGVSTSVVARAEAGGNVGLAQAAGLASAYGTTLGALLSDAEATTAERELFQRAADALWDCAKSALTVKPSLDEPCPDYPEWTPYTRWVERPARQAHDLAMAIRKHLKEKGNAEPG